MEFGPFLVPAPPSLETGLASALLACFHVPRCAHSLKHTKSIVLMWSITGSVRMMVITRTLERGNDRGAVWDGPRVLLSPCWLRVAHRPADMM